MNARDVLADDIRALAEAACRLLAVSDELPLVELRARAALLNREMVRLKRRLEAVTATPPPA